MSLEGALLLRSRGLNPTLIMAMPIDPANHLDFLRYKYYQVLWDPTQTNVLKVINCPDMASFGREQEEKMQQLFKTNVCKEIINEIVNEMPERPSYANNDDAECMDFPPDTYLGSEGYSITSNKRVSVTFENSGNDGSSDTSDFYPTTKTEKDDFVYFSEYVSGDVVASGVGQSISKALVNDDQHFLSVLSKANVASEIPVENREKGFQNKQKFCKFNNILFVLVPWLGSKLDEIDKSFGYLETFFREVLNQREYYFEEHNRNPGLFTGVVSEKI